MKGNWESLRQKLKEKIQKRLDLSRELTDEEVLELIDEEILAQSRQEYLLLEEKLCMRKEIFYAMRRLDLLQELMEDPEITEIMVNGPEAVFVERRGRLSRWDKSFSSRQKLEDVVVTGYFQRKKVSQTGSEVLVDGEELRKVGLTVPQTTALLWELRNAGCDVPLDALSDEECAQALYALLQKQK